MHLYGKCRDGNEIACETHIGTKMNERIAQLRND